MNTPEASPEPGPQAPWRGGVDGQPHADRLVVVDSPVELAQIYDDDVVAVVWRGALVADLATLPGPQGRFVLEVGDVPAVLTLGSLLAVVEVFASLADTDHVGLRWRTLLAPMCPRWHVDQVELRGCVTLRGPGTELQIDGATITTNVGDLVVMKGTRLHARGCRHRSPAQEGDSDGDRVVVTFDCAS
jgi:hypothetical protein